MRNEMKFTNQCGGKPKFFSVLIVILVLLSLSTINYQISTAYAALSCNSCHGYPPSYASILPNKGNSHVAHNGYSCEKCHIEVTTGPYTISFATNHVNGTYQVGGASVPASTYKYDIQGSSCTPNCHAEAYWGGSLTCADCHDANGATVNENAGVLGGKSDSTANEVDMAQHNDTGHGNTGTYDADSIGSGGGNSGASLSCYSTGQSTPVGGCHASGAQHTPTTAAGNPYRIVTDYASNLDGLCSYTGCHSQSLENHIESLFNSPNHAGAWVFQPKCIDCHDPHGDGTTTGNIFMIHNKVHNTGSDTYGAPTGGATEAVTFSNDTVADNWGDRTASAGNAICETCHTVTTVFRTTGGDSTHYATDACDTCHTHAAAFEGSGECIGCHDGYKGPRRPIKPEFLLTWSHKRSTGSVKNNDCAVCHLEGNASDGKTTSWHKELSPGTTATPVGTFAGFINLRDPDSTTQNTMIKLSSWSATAKAYQNNTNAHTGYLYKVTASGFEFVQFRRDTTKKDLEPWTISVQNNLCLKCHDYDGCISTWVPGGSALKPFNSNIIYTTWTATRVLDVSVQLSTENKNITYHPVRGRQNNDYCDSGSMLSPWNGIAKTVGAPLEYGFLISCWDCHNRASPSVLSSGTVTAHGGATTLRAAYSRTGAQATPLCVVCHNSSVYWGSAAPIGLTAFDGSITDAVHPYTGATRHAPAGSGISTAWTCISCHSSAYTSQPSRPRAAEDIHGNNGGVTTAKWAVIGGAATQAPPFAFFRDIGDQLEGWRPKSWPGESAGEGGGYCSGNTQAHCGRQTAVTYTPGGDY
jgi:hypothetical protein